MKIRIKIVLLILLFSVSIMQNYEDDYEDDYEDVYEPQCDLDFDGEDDCDKFLSFASTNWHQNDYRGCIDQYKTALYCNCEEGYELELYKYLGRAFVEVGILDSANWAFERGLYPVMVGWPISCSKKLMFWNFRSTDPRVLPVRDCTFRLYSAFTYLVPSCSRSNISK